MNKVVYHLIDPRTNLPFYVGMGGKKRAYDHVLEVKRNVSSNVEKNRIINELLSLNLSPIIKFISLNLTIQQAKELEILEIKKFGRLDLHTGILTNLTNGGDSPPEFNKETLTRLSVTSIEWHIKNKNSHKNSCKEWASSERNKKRVSEWSKQQIRDSKRKNNHRLASLESQNRPDVKFKKSLALKGKKRTNEQIENIRAGQLVKAVRDKNSLRKTGGLNPRAKKCEYLSETFNCVNDVVLKHKISRYFITQHHSFRYL